MNITRVISWRWKEDAPIEAIAKAANTVSGGLVHIYRVDTGTDRAAVVINREPLTEDEVADIWHGEWGDYE